MKRRALFWTLILSLLCVGLSAWLVRRELRQEPTIVDLVNVLLEHGANPDVSDKYGNTPLKLAQKAKLKQVVNVLQDAGATH